MELYFSGPQLPAGVAGSLPRLSSEPGSCQGGVTPILPLSFYLPSLGDWGSLCSFCLTEQMSQMLSEFCLISGSSRY